MAKNSNGMRNNGWDRTGKLALAFRGNATRTRVCDTKQNKSHSQKPLPDQKRFLIELCTKYDHLFFLLVLINTALRELEKTYKGVQNQPSRHFGW